MIRQLITDADILSGRVRSPIVLVEGTVLTPAARDRAAARGMQIVEADAARDGAASAATRASGGCANCSCSGCAYCQGGPSAASASVSGPPVARLPEILGASCGKRPEDLGDGLYLVRIEAGRTVSVLPATGPGLLARSRAP